MAVKSQRPGPSKHAAKAIMDLCWEIYDKLKESGELDQCSEVDSNRTCGKRKGRKCGPRESPCKAKRPAADCTDASAIQDTLDVSEAEPAE